MTANEHWRLATRIAAISLASDSAITIARFRPSKCVFVLVLLRAPCAGRYEFGRVWSSMMMSG